MPAVARQFVGEVLRITGADDLRARVVPETPGRKGDRRQQRRKRKFALRRFGHSLGLDAIIVVRSRPETTLGRTLFDAAA
jgi:hypothetical protein